MCVMIPGKFFRQFLEPPKSFQTCFKIEEIFREAF